MADLPPCRLATWAEIDRWADTLTAKVRAAGRVPDVIVGLTRGGWVPARLLADRLLVKRMGALRAQHWGVTATPTGKAEITEGLTAPVADSNVLVVDDITDTGESLELAVAHVRERGPARVESAAYLHIGHSKYVPTYHAEEIPGDRWVWVVFPWTYWEDLTTLGGRAWAEAGTAAGARDLLRSRSGLEVPLRDLEAIRPGPGP